MRSSAAHSRLTRLRLQAPVRHDRHEGKLRRDLPEASLLSTYPALAHAAGHDITAGALAAHDTEQALHRELASAAAITFI